MQVLATWTIRHGDAERRIEVLHGDLTRLPPAHAVDVLVVSAFADDYLPTSGSLVGAFARAGLSIAALAADKRVDLREQFSCWLSKPLPPAFNARQIVCIESGWRGQPPEITDDLFRALAPFVIEEFPEAAVAMPLIGAGDQGYQTLEMLSLILRAAVGWIERGLKLRVLKIVILDQEIASKAAARVEVLKAEHKAARRSSQAREATDRVGRFDVFVSYARDDQGPLADFAVAQQEESAGHLRVFIDREGLKPGASWMLELADALDASRRVIAMLSPSYWRSPNCKSEFLAALARQRDTGSTILFPLLLEEVDIRYMFREVQQFDCRVNDRARVGAACKALAASLGQGVQ